MANTELISGVDSFLLFKAESTFGTPETTPQTHLGLVQNFNPTIDRDAKEHRGFVGSTSGGQLPSQITSGIVTTGFSVDFKPLEWTWLENVMGSVNAADGTAGTPFVYSFAANPSGVTFSNNIDNDTTDREEKYAGCRFSNTTIRAALGDAVSVSMEVQALNFSKDSTIQSNSALPTGEISNFSGATLELPDGSAISNIIDSIEISITRAVNRKPGLGSYQPQISKYGQTELRINFTINYLDDTFLDLVNGSSTTITAMTDNATLTVRFDTSDTNRFVEFKFTNVKLPNFAETANLNEFITEGITCWAKDLTVEETQAA